MSSWVTVSMCFIILKLIVIISFRIMKRLNGVTETVFTVRYELGFVC